MLCLAEQVHRHPIGRRGAVGQHQDFAGPGDHVDAYLPEDPALGAGHIRIARASDFVDTRHGGRAIGQRGDGLRTTHGEYAVHPCHSRCRQHQRVALTARCGHDHDDLAHPRHLRRYGIHQHAGRIGRFATRNINAHTVQRRHLLAQARAVFIHKTPAAATRLQLARVVAVHTPRCGFERKS